MKDALAAEGEDRCNHNQIHLFVSATAGETMSGRLLDATGCS